MRQREQSSPYLGKTEPARATPAGSEKLPAASPCFLIVGKEPRRLQIPVNLSTLQQMVLDGALRPGDLVARSHGEPPRPLREYPELVPAAALRKKILFLYRSRREDEALEWIERFYELDGESLQPDRTYVLFLEALIREKSDHQRAIDLYLSILASSGHDLARVVHNNLSVLKCRSEDIASALEHVKPAAEGRPPFLAGLLNYKTILERALDVSRERPLPPGSVNLEDAETILAGLEKQIQDASRVSHRSSVGVSDGGVPGEDCATLIRPDELPATLARAGAPVARTGFAYRCIGNARAALAARSWSEVRFWVEEAKNSDPDDPVVRADAARLIELADAKNETDLLASRAGGQESLLAEIQDLERRGDYATALRRTSVLLASAGSADSMSAALELNDRLRKKLSEQHLHDARRKREESPEKAAGLYRAAARLHDAHRAEAEVEEALLQWPVVKKDFLEAIDAADFHRAAASVRRLSQLATTPEFEEEARRMHAELVRAQGEHELDRARRAAEAHDFVEARRLLMSAETRDARTAGRAKKLLEEVTAREIRAFRDDVLQEFTSGSVQRALEKLQAAPSHYFTDPDVCRLLEVVTKASRRNLHQQVQEKFIKLKSAVGTDDFARAQELLDDVMSLQPDCVDLVNLRAHIERAEKLYHARSAACRKKFQEAVAVLVPLLGDEPEAFSLLQSITEEDLDQLVKEPEKRRKIREYAVASYRLVADGRRRTAIQKLERLLERVPQFRMPRFVIQVIIGITNDHLGECRDAVENGEWQRAAEALSAAERDWGIEAPPREIRDVIKSWRHIIEEEGDVEGLGTKTERLSRFLRSVFDSFFLRRETK